jgi:NADPH:quinone reductase-like Zn-dependent oxidoreductase
MELRPIVDRTFPIESAADALRHLESGGQFGKVVLEI